MLRLSPHVLVVMRLSFVQPARSFLCRLVIPRSVFPRLFFFALSWGLFLLCVGRVSFSTLIAPDTLLCPHLSSSLCLLHLIFCLRARVTLLCSAVALVRSSQSLLAASSHACLVCTHLVLVSASDVSLPSPWLAGSAGRASLPSPPSARPLGVHCPCAARLSDSSSSRCGLLARYLVCVRFALRLCGSATLGDGALFSLACALFVFSELRAVFSASSLSCFPPVSCSIFV